VLRSAGSQGDAGRTPGKHLCHPPHEGWGYSDFEITGEMLRYFIAKVHNRKALLRPRVVNLVPSGITPVEKRAVRESAQSQGQGDLPDRGTHGAAIGAGLPITEGLREHGCRHRGAERRKWPSSPFRES